MANFSPPPSPPLLPHPLYPPLLPPTRLLTSFTLTGQKGPKGEAGPITLIRSHLSVQTAGDAPTLRDKAFLGRGQGGLGQREPTTIPHTLPLRNTCQHARRQPCLDEASRDGQRCDASIYKGPPKRATLPSVAANPPVGGALFSQAQRFTTTEWLVLTRENRQEVSHKLCDSMKVAKPAAANRHTLHKYY